MPTPLKNNFILFINISGTNVTTSYTYDIVGNPLTLTDANGNITNYNYDGYGRLKEEIYPDGKKIIKTYDDNSNTLTVTDPNGTVVTNTIDSLNRITHKSIVLGTGVEGVTSEDYTYDSLGHLVDTTDGTNNLTFSYDSLGNLIKETQNGKEVTSSYDANGRLTGLVSPSGNTITNSYDNIGRLIGVSGNNTNYATYSYSGVNLVNTLLGNGKNITENYDTINRLSSLNNGIKDYLYTYDNVSNITSDSFKNYSYDELYRVVGVNSSTGGLLESFNYDKVGSRVNDGVNDYVTNNLNQYTSLSGTTLSGSLIYDNNGNLLENENNKYVYDYRNRLVMVIDKSYTQVIEGTGIYDESGTLIGTGASQNITIPDTLKSDYSYDTLGRRISKDIYNTGGTIDSNITYIYSGDKTLEEIEIDGSGNIIKTKNYIYGNGGVDDIVASIQNGTIYYYHKDNLGSIIGITDSTGSLVSKYEYDVYGKTTLVEGSDVGNTRLFTGREFDKESNLYYYRARYYDAELGRFISRDPIDTSDDINLYGYVGENPVNGVDPTGLKGKTLIIRSPFIPLISYEPFSSHFKNYNVANKQEEIYKNIGFEVEKEYVKDGDDFVKQYNNFVKNMDTSKYNKIIYVGHNYDFFRPELINNKKLSQLNKVSSKNIDITFLSCNTVGQNNATNDYKGNIGTAQIFTNQTNIKSYGFYGTVTYESNGKYSTVSSVTEIYPSNK